MAFHEAGHAAACFALGAKFAYVTITPSEDTGGHLKHSGGRRFPWAKLRQLPYERLPAWIDRRLMISIAGQVAQKKGAPRSVRRWHAGGDRVAVDEFFSATNCAGEEEYFRYCVVRLECMFSKPWIWSDVVALVDALLERRKLTYSECKEVASAARNSFLASTQEDMQQIGRGAGS